ncbi:hypothetical protein [Dyella sp.]|uniref:hypothetical protein n=1 Tax=Dyella sp. TaxID=1869338 RepID=UPI002ECFDCC3
MKKLVLLASLAALAVSGCATKKTTLATQISGLIDQTTQAQTEPEAFLRLESYGENAVPYLVQHLNDMRPLGEKNMVLKNIVIVDSKKTEQGQRMYSPEVVHDALAALLNQITGKSFEFVYNGSDPATRATNSKEWQDWCMKTYPDKKAICKVHK